jgi:SPP1 gp7 family putative phage head morphogenesis protein
MIDYGHEQTEKELKKLEKRLSKEYSAAYKEMKKKADDYFRKFNERDSLKQKQVKEGKITQKEYVEWRQKQMLVGENYKKMVNSLAQDMTRTNENAAALISENMMDAYIENGNFGAYEVAKGINVDFTFTLYSRDTVANLIKNKDFPTPKVNVPKDELWNKQKINSAIIQGVLQGESIPKIAKRLQSVADMNNVSAVRNARTYITGAENRGRIDSYKYCESLGIEIEQMWIATLDGRTRESHRKLDGETVKVGEQFSNGCEYPGDPDGPDEEIYNCRCTLIADLKDYKITKEDFYDRKLGSMDDVSYNEWKNQHEGEE